MQNQLSFQAKQQVTQAVVQHQIDQATAPTEPNNAEMASRGHESNMMDKKIELEKIKSKKQAAPAKKPAKKKTISEQAKDLKLTYVGRGLYADSGNVVTHINENGRLLPYINKD
jgi:hypothetical protein